MYDYSVIEFKYSVDLDDQFRSIYPFFSDIALRNTKSSKYSNSLMYWRLDAVIILISHPQVDVDCPQ